MKLTLSQAAKETGISKPTLSRWIRKGVISAEKLETGGYHIDASELDRVLSLKDRRNTAPRNGNPKILQTETPGETHRLQREIDLLRERLADKDGVIDDLRRRRDTESEERRKLTLLLIDGREKKGFLQRLFA